MKQDKADKIIKKAELKAQKAAKQVEVASRKAEIAKQKQAVQAQKKAAKAADSATKKAAKKTKKAEQAAKKAQLAAQKAEEKKVKAIAKAAAKATGAPAAKGGGGEEGAPAGGKKGKKKDKKKLLMIAIPVLAVAIGAGAFFFLRGGGKEEEEDAPPEPIAAPAEYVLNESHITALPVWGDVVVYQEEVPIPAEPEENAEGEEGEEAAASTEEVPTHTVYRYETLQEPSVLVSAYTALMTTADAGFSTVDETLERIDPPEEFGSSGTVQLARNVPKAEDGTGGGVHSLLLSWSGTTCSVTLDTPEGVVHDPKPETPASTTAPRRSLSDIQALHPSKLGLPGESMDAYKLMPQDGSVRIAGEGSPTMQINVYDENGQYAARIFLSGSGRLYKLDENVNAVVELDWE